MKTETQITIYGCDRGEAALFEKVSPRFGFSPLVTAEGPTKESAPLSKGSRCVSVGHRSKITRNVLMALSEAGVEYVCTRSIGTDHIDIAAAEELGISLGNTCYPPDGVADYTLMLMLMAARNAKSTLLRANRHDYFPETGRGRELCNMTVGIVGTGRIGQAVIRRLRGFGCGVLAFDRRQTAAAEYVSLEELLKRSDIVSLHLPLSADTHHLLNAERMAAMKPGAILINTGRGALIDTPALLEALEEGALGAAALDVVEGEEDMFFRDCSESSLENAALLRLQTLKNVIITPHTAYYTEQVLQDSVIRTLESFLMFERERKQWIS